MEKLKNENKSEANQVHNDLEFEKILKECENRIQILNDNLNENFDNMEETLNYNLKDVTKLLNSMKFYVDKEKCDVDKMIDVAKKYEMSDGEIVKLNIGGKIFSTIKSNLTNQIEKINADLNSELIEEFHEPHLFQILLNGVSRIIYDENKAIFIDRDPKYFEYILKYLRSVSANRPFNLPQLNKYGFNELIIEAEFYNLKGLLEEIETKYESLILSLEQSNQLNKLCEFSKLQKWKLLYRGTRDDFDSNIFHAKCDDKTNTLVVIQTNKNYIFGGFTTAAWDHSANYKPDANSFLFSLVNPSSSPQKLILKNQENSIYCKSGYGPTFGGGHDIYISSLCNLNKTSYSNLGYSYQTSPECTYNTDTAQKFLAGSKHFQVKEIEVFQKI